MAMGAMSKHHHDHGSHTHAHATHGHAHGHGHVPAEIRHERPVWIALALTLLFMLAEIAGGLWSNSLALLSDAAHMLTDATALGIALMAAWMARRPADARRTYGYARMEAIAALINAALLLVAAAGIVLEALQRLRTHETVASDMMLAVAVFGLLVNLVSMRLLAVGAGESLNLKAAYLEVWSDMLGSLGVIVGALLIHFTGWVLLDPLIAVLIALWVLPRTWTLLRAAVQILMQGVPAGLDIDTVRDAMQAVPGVATVHDLHVWALGSREPILTAHVLLADSANDVDGVRRAVAEVLRVRFGIAHATLQVEIQHCGSEGLHE
jgi:cobalt-zinc-cadmium efflux system protein